jgi:hypothetical protein
LAQADPLAVAPSGAKAVAVLELESLSHSLRYARWCLLLGCLGTLLLEPVEKVQASTKSAQTVPGTVLAVAAGLVETVEHSKNLDFQVAMAHLDAY